MSVPPHLLRARRFVAQHLDEALDLERIALGARVSKYHLHHEFSAHFNLSLGRYVRLLRFERAANQLAFRRDAVLKIALDAGFTSGEAFARAFKREIGRSPSEFRRAPDWLAVSDRLAPLHQVNTAPDPIRKFEVARVESRAVRLLGMTHQGDPRRIGETIAHFIAWRRGARLPPDRFDTYNLLHTPLDIEPRSAFRLDVATVAPSSIPYAGELWERTLPGAPCAVLSVHGGDEALGPAFDYLYRFWLREHPVQLLDHPPLLRRVRFFPDVPRVDSVTEIRLLLQG